MYLSVGAWLHATPSFSQYSEAGLGCCLYEYIFRLEASYEHIAYVRFWDFLVCNGEQQAVIVSQDVRRNDTFHALRGGAVSLCLIEKRDTLARRPAQTIFFMLIWQRSLCRLPFRFFLSQLENRR